MLVSKGSYPANNIEIIRIKFKARILIAQIHYYKYYVPLNQQTFCEFNSNNNHCHNIFNM